MPTQARRKTERTFYTDERIASARENIKQYKWAQDLLKRIMTGDTIRYYIGPDYASAEQFSAQSDEFMWLLQPTTKLKRHVLQQVEVYKCPTHGWEGKKSSWSGAVWCPWRIDPINHPYKIQCLAGNEWYPSNDYHKGDMTTGPWADDGNGFEHKGERYYPLREYAHMVYGSVVIPCLKSLSQAYLITGEKKYAHKGAILLARLASEYPNHDDRRDRLYDLRNYKKNKGLRTGMITDYIWENFCFEDAVLAYDALFDYLDDPQLISFLKQKGMPVNNGNDLRAYIEDNLLRAGMKALLIGGIRGNEGHHQAAAMASALVLNNFTQGRVNSADMVEYYYYGIGNAAYLLANNVTPDGGGHESPNYNRIKLDMLRASKLMEQLRQRHPERFPTDKYPDIFSEPKAKALFNYLLDVIMLDYYVPSIGDCGGIRATRRVDPQYYSYRPTDFLYAFQRYGDPRFARACTKPDGSFMPGELFEPYPAKALKAALKKPASQIIRKPRLFDDYGIAILESGAGAHRRGVYLNYVSPWGHRQADHLHMGLFARGVDLLPDLGYPLTYYYRWTWDCNSMAHNTVTVNEIQPQRTLGGRGRLFASVNGVHVAVASHDPYPPEHKSYPATFPAFPKDAPPVDLFERMLLLVDVDAERFYVVDLFAVRGGEQHDQSWHGTLDEVRHPQLDWQLQQGGTLAGPKVKSFSKWTDRWGNQREDFPAFMKNIRRARIDQPAAWTWETALPEGDALRLHLIPVGGAMEVIAGTGRAPSRPENWGLDYILARRLVKDGARSLFLSVIDAYQKTPVINEIRLLSENPIKLEVIRADGKDEITLTTPPGPSRTTAPRAIGIRVQSQTNGVVTRDVRIGAATPKGEPGYAQAEIKAVDYESNRIVLAHNPEFRQGLQPGRTLRIFNEYRSAQYQIHAVEATADSISVTLGRTAHLARLPLKKVVGNSLRIGTNLVFANGYLDSRGQPQPTHDNFRGALLGEDKDARRVRAIAGHRLFFEQNVPATKLRSDYANQTFNLWQYGPGDQVELTRITH